jgi:hypothetical protein
MSILHLQMRRGIIRVAFAHFLFLTLSLLSITSCNKESNASLPQPIIDLTNTTNCGCEPFIDLYTWRNDATYVMSCKGPTCLCGVIYYDERGVQMEMPPGYTFNDFSDEARFERNIWTCKP